MKHLLHFQDVARAGVRASLNNQLDELGTLFVRDALARHNGCFSLCLLSEEQKSESKSEESREGILEILLVFPHQSLENAL